MCELLRFFSAIAGEQEEADAAGGGVEEEEEEEEGTNVASGPSFPAGLEAAARHLRLQQHSHSPPGAVLGAQVGYDWKPKHCYACCCDSTLSIYVHVDLTKASFQMVVLAGNFQHRYRSNAPLR